jgi:hypothetical protein
MLKKMPLIFNSKTGRFTAGVAKSVHKFQEGKKMKVFFFGMKFEAVC